jgi:hypothetical protein
VNGFALFEPAGLFQTYNKKDLLAKDGEDLAHYAKTALETVGLAQYNRIIKIIHKNFFEWLIVISHIANRR